MKLAVIEKSTGVLVGFLRTKHYYDGFTLNIGLAQNFDKLKDYELKEKLNHIDRKYHYEFWSITSL